MPFASPALSARLTGGSHPLLITPTARRAALLIAGHFAAALLVLVTGGPMSPLYSLLFGCLFLATLYYGAWGAVISAGMQLVLLASLTRSLLDLHFGPTSNGAWFVALPRSLAFLEQVPLLAPVAFVGCQFIVALTTGFIARRFSEKANRALAQAAWEHTQVERVQWLTDTVLMMQSLVDLEQVLSIALLRLSERIPADSIAIYLCDTEEPILRLAQTMGLPQEQVRRHRLPLAELPLYAGGRAMSPLDADEAKLWNRLDTDRAEMGEWAEIDAKAQSTLVAPLQTLEEAFGAIYVSAHRPDAFTEEHRCLLTDFSRQVLYPIQRVRLETLATTDALTGLFNRRVFWRHLNDEVRRSRRYGPPLSLLLLDIDHFKRVNDSLGHQAGDAILSQLAGLLQRSVRTIDKPVRYGGEEMAVLCPETPSKEAVGVAERIRREVEKWPFTLPDGSTTHITISVGVGTLSETVRDGTTLVEAADAALYGAKAAGRNRVSLTPASH